MRLHRYAFVLGLLFILVLGHSAQAQDTAQGNWQVIDGDTIRHGERVVRLWGIDAPEINQRCLNADRVEYKCGQDSKFALEEIIKDKPLVCKFLNRDRYGRDVAQCYLEGVDIGGLMVGLGRAIEYRRYSKGHYEAEQFQAQKNGLGVWQGEFEEPKEYRKGKKGI